MICYHWWLISNVNINVNIHDVFIQSFMICAIFPSSTLGAFPWQAGFSGFPGYSCDVAKQTMWVKQWWLNQPVKGMVSFYHLYGEEWGMVCGIVLSTSIQLEEKEWLWDMKTLARCALRTHASSWVLTLRFSQRNIYHISIWIDQKSFRESDRLLLKKVHHF